LNSTTCRTLCLLIAISLLSGCSTFRDTWKDTRSLYKNYVNTDTKVDISCPPSADAAQLKLAKLFMPVDENLEKLLRLFSAQDIMPPADWCRDLMGIYPWLAGVAVISDSGQILSKYPEADLIPTNFDPLLEQKARYQVRKMAGQVDVTELGALVYIATPLFKENEWSGILVAYFDPRSLVKLSPNPADLFIVASEGVLWEGGDPAAAKTLAAAKWADTLKGDICGTVSSNGGQYIWQARYIGNKPIIYLTNAKTPFVSAAPAAVAAPETPAAPPEAAPVQAAPATPGKTKPEKAAKAEKAKKAKKTKEKVVTPAAPAPEQSVQPTQLGQPVEPLPEDAGAPIKQPKKSKNKIQEKTLAPQQGAAPAAPDQAGQSGQPAAAAPAPAAPEQAAPQAPAGGTDSQ
jgi:hypothetical protein